MILAQTSLLADGMAMNMIAVTIVLNCHSNSGKIAFRIRSQYKCKWTERTKYASLSREGYNIVFLHFKITRASYAELEIMDMDNVDMIYYATINSVSEVDA